MDMKEFPPTPKNLEDNVISLDDWRRERPDDVGGGDRKKEYDPEYGSGRGEVISLNGPEYGTEEWRSIYVQRFLRQYSDDLDALPEEAREHFMGQVHIFESGEVGNAIGILENVLSDLKEMAAEGELWRIQPEETTKTQTMEADSRDIEQDSEAKKSSIDKSTLAISALRENLSGKKDSSVSRGDTQKYPPLRLVYSADDSVDE